MLNFVSVLHHKYQQCDLYKTEKYVQTNILIENSTPVFSPKRPPRRIDAAPIDISYTDQTNSDCYQYNGDLNSDRDFNELKKLRLEACMNINSNNVSDNLSEPLLSSDYVNSINIVLILGPTRVDDLLMNTSLMDLIKLDVKETVNKRLKECYKVIDETVEQDNILHEMVFITIIT